MTGFYKLIFDLSVYYTLTGFYLNIFLDVSPSAQGFVLLCLMAGIQLLARRNNAPVWQTRSSFLLPILVLVFRPGLWGVLHMLPAWAYSAWCLETMRIGTDYRTFREKYLFGLRLQLACLPGLVLSTVGPAAAASVMPYLLVLLTVGVCCLRCLRQPGSSVYYGILTALFVALCMAMTIGGVPAFLLNALNWIYQEIIVRMFQAAGTVLLLIVSFIFKILADFSKVKPNQKEEIVDMGIGTVQEMLGIEESTDISSGAQWLMVISYVIVGIAVIVLFAWMVIRLLGSLDTRKQAVVVYSTKTEPIDVPQFRPRLFKPKDPRERVRYYYALFLRECKARGMEVSAGSTGQELAQQCLRYFPEADPHALSAIYTPARYCNSQPVTEKQAEAAAKVWSSLRKTKYKRLDK